MTIFTCQFCACMEESNYTDETIFWLVHCFLHVKLCCHVGLDAWTVGAIFECKAEFKLSGAMGLLFCQWMSCLFPAPFVFLRLFAKNYGIARGQTNQSAKFKKSLIWRIWFLHFKNVWQNSITRNRCSWWRKQFLLFRISNNYHNHNKIRSKLNHIMNYFSIDEASSCLKYLLRNLVSDSS